MGTLKVRAGCLAAMSPALCRPSRADGEDSQGNEDADHARYTVTFALIGVAGFVHRLDVPERLATVPT